MSTSANTAATAAPGSLMSNGKMRPSLLTHRATLIENMLAPGTKVSLESLWQGPPAKPVVLSFLRRLGCVFCRNLAKKLDDMRVKHGDHVRFVCLSFETLGKGSDDDRSFEKGKYFEGEMYTIDMSIYKELFGSKGFTSMFGFSDYNGDVLKEAKARGIDGNYKNGSTGMQLGGMFVVGPDGTVALDKRQGFYGDDPTAEDVLAALLPYLPPAASSAAASNASSAAASPPASTVPVAGGGGGSM